MNKSPDSPRALLAAPVRESSREATPIGPHARIYGLAENFQRNDATPQTCMELCRQAHDACVRATALHVKAWDPASPLLVDQVRLLADCAQICRTTADYVARSSPYYFYFCFLCSAVCEACAESCELSELGNECVQLCRSCAVACRKIAE